MSDRTWRFRGGIWLRDLRQKRHWGEVQERSWQVWRLDGRLVRREMAAGRCGNADEGKRAVDDWERSH